MSRAVTVTISSRNAMSAAGLVKCDAGEAFVIVVVNDDDRDHKVWIDGADVVFKKPRKAANPLSLKTRKVKIRAGSIGVIRQRLKSKSQFFSRRSAGPHGTKVPYGRYKYTIRWSNLSGGAKKLDPDLEVSPPI